MNNQIENFLNYLLDWDTTSEIAFIETIQKHAEFFDSRYLKDWEHTVFRYLQQIHHEPITSALISTEIKSDDESSDEQSTSSSEDEDENENPSNEQTQKFISTQRTNTYFDPTRQCQRLLHLLHYCQENYSHFSELYFRTLEQYLKSDNSKTLIIALQQIASHLFQGTNHPEHKQRLGQFISPTFRTIPSYQPVLSTIDRLLSIERNELDVVEFLANYSDIVYPYSAHFLDARREFRDSTNYLIDGDSLLLSVAHHTNIDLHSYFGNTLHVTFVIERILRTLYQQSQQCNYTLVFFDCHHRLYQHESSILTLLRACLIFHLSKNIYGKHAIRLYQFSSWQDEDYLQLIRDDKPMFLFYHDMSNFDREKDRLLSKETLEKLLCIYRLFGNYHQYTAHCQLYLMNKLTLTDTSVQCFQIQFNRMCSKKLVDEILPVISCELPHSNGVKEQDWNEEIADSDIRLNLYLQSLHYLEDNNKQLDLVADLTPLLILHVALLIRLSLADRHLLLSLPSVTFSPNLSRLIAEFQQRLALNLVSSTSSSYSKIADLFDGRLLTFTLHQLQQKSTLSLDSQTRAIIQQSLGLFGLSWNETIFHQSLNQLIQSHHIIFTPSSSSSTKHQSKSNRRQLIQISNPFLDRYLQPILSSKDSPSIAFIEPDDRQIFEMKWKEYQDAGDEISRINHNNIDRLQLGNKDQRNKQNKNLYSDKDGDERVAEDPKKTTNHRYRTKAQQKLYDYFNLYGKSLTTRDIRDNQLQIILPTPTRSSSVDQTASATSNTKKKSQGHKNQPNKVQVSKAQQIIDDNKRRILDKRVDDEGEKLKNVETRLKQVASDDYAQGINLIEESLPSFQTPTTRFELLKRKFDLQRKYLRSLKKKSTLSIEEKSKLELLQVGFFATLCEMVHVENVMDPFQETKKFMQELVDDSALDAEKWYRFQLEKINSRLPRQEQGTPDPRVPEFIPDQWQVKFLDAVDKRHSIIIVAPTASGKTYASYYAMEKVFKDKNDTKGLCIYVSPTKALINQVAGTIYSKFGAIFGVFTRDYHMNLETCRILITVPECLEMLLLSSDYQRWCQRIRYCIFDEIHCMSGDPGTDVWERTMLLINCPMIGLSATVNNGNNVQEWITHVEQERSRLFRTSAREVCLISHHVRLADLNKYLYSNRQLYPLHPISLMNSKQLISRGIPKDFSLSPCETLRLNDAMQKIRKTNGAVPTLTEHFSPNWVAERGLCNSYSKLVSDQLEELIHTNQTTTIDSISTSLNPTTIHQISYPELKPMASVIGEFVLTLREKNLLPCIVFTDSRNLCEDLAASVAQYFEELEKDLRQTKYKHHIEVLEKRVALIEKMQKSNKPKKPVKSASKRNDDEESSADKPGELQQMEEEDQSQFRLSGYEQDLLNGILEEGTLADRRHCDQEFIDRLMERAATGNPRLAGYLKRGVAYHHAQLNNKGRLAVEGLFRNRYVQVVFSTWTLALGVHMPTKTVAFVKDSMQLDALQFRQSSGRAGRRGFDVQGNIVFLDIPMSKIRHLTISAIPDIKTHLPSSVTFLMRLLHFNSTAEDKVDAINRSLIALQCPLNAQSTSTQHLIDIQLRFHCLHTLDFLYRLNLIDEEGNLIGLAGLLLHLHRFEPASILLTYLFNTELFHQLTDEEEIINVLAYLFTNRPWAVTSSSSKNRQSLFNPKHALRPLASKIRQHIQTYNGLVRDIYGNYIENVIEKIRSMNTGQEYLLPFSQISFHQSSDYENGTFEYQLHHHHTQQSHNPSISPFAAPSGLTHEQFMSNYHSTTGSWDLACDLDLSPRLVPYVDIDACDQTNASYYLNSFALDYFKHGSERLLMSENQLDRGETYHLLADFLFPLTSIRTSVDHIYTQLKQIKNPDQTFFKPLGIKFQDIHALFMSKFQKEFK